MLKFVFLLDLQSSVILNAKPKRKVKKVKKALERLKEYARESDLSPNSRLKPVKVNSVVNIYGQVNEKNVLFGVFADSSQGSIR